MVKTMDEKISAVEREIEKLKNRKTKLMQTHKAQVRKNLDKRLRSRSTYLEKVLPDLANLTDEQFESFVRKTLQTGFAEKILKQLLSPAPVTINSTKSVQNKNGNISALDAADNTPADAVG